MTGPGSLPWIQAATLWPPACITNTSQRLALLAKRVPFWSSLVAQWLRIWGCSCCGLGFDSWPRNFHFETMDEKKKKKSPFFYWVRLAIPSQIQFHLCNFFLR